MYAQVPAGRPVLLATMSSEDELMAVRLIDAMPRSVPQASLFRDQFEWVEFLFDYARLHPEVHLILRLHPRMQVENSHGCRKCGFGFWSSKNPRICHGFLPVGNPRVFRAQDPKPASVASVTCTDAYPRIFTCGFLEYL